MSDRRPTLSELRDGTDEPKQIAGKPADQCPYCGCAMFANGTSRGDQTIYRYVVCRNPACGKRFLSKQPKATLMREVGGGDDSNIGENAFRVLGDVG